MTPKDKADELMDKFLDYDGTDQGCDYTSYHMAKYCSNIAVDEILDMLRNLLMSPEQSIAYKYYLDVKKEINNI